MKRIILFVSVLFISSAATYAQGELDAYKLSRNELRGTARSVAMGGAFGALGGDVSAIAINPAGIGVYKKSEVVTTFNFQNSKTETQLNTTPQTDSKFSADFDNFAFVSIFPMQSESTPLLNFGFSYNKLKSFDRNYQLQGYNVSNSLSDYMANIATTSRYTPQNLALYNGTIYQKDKWRSGPNWLALLGYNAYLIDENPVNSSKYTSTTQGIDVDNALLVQERGSINSYDFNMGTTISNVLSLGLTVSVTDIDYRMYSKYTEEFRSYGIPNPGYDMINTLSTEGTGTQVGAGFIYKPIPELRLGVSYHSPTWYTMTDRYGVDLDHNLSAMLSDYTPGTVRSFDGDWAATDYTMRTPDRWTFSLAGVINEIAILSADYEVTNYKSSMKLFEADGRQLSYNPNGAIQAHFKNASTLRLGAEIRFTPRFSGRVGYAWMESPMQANFKNGRQEAGTVGSVAHFTLDGDTNYFTYGLGYKFTRNFYTDVAFAMRTQKDDLYSFDQTNFARTDRATLKTDTFQGMITFGYKFD